MHTLSSTGPFRTIKPMPSQESARSTPILSLRALHTSDDASNMELPGIICCKKISHEEVSREKLCVCVCFHMFSGDLSHINIFNTRNQAVEATGSPDVTWIYEPYWWHGTWKVLWSSSSKRKFQNVNWPNSRWTLKFQRKHFKKRCKTLQNKKTCSYFIFEPWFSPFNVFSHQIT